MGAGSSVGYTSLPVWEVRSESDANHEVIRKRRNPFRSIWKLSKMLISLECREDLSPRSRRFSRHSDPKFYPYMHLSPFFSLVMVPLNPNAACRRPSIGCPLLSTTNKPYCNFCFAMCLSTGSDPRQWPRAQSSRSLLRVVRTMPENVFVWPTPLDQRA